MRYELILICCLFFLFGSCQSDRQQETAGHPPATAEDNPPQYTGKMRRTPGNESKYTLFAEFAATHGDILIEGDSVKIYSLASPNETPYTPQLLSETISPGQDSPVYQYSVYLWEENKFSEIHRDSLRYVPRGEYNIDQENTTDLSVGSAGILNALRQRNLNRILIKHHIQADLDMDGELEDVLVYSRPEAGEFGYYYGIIIIEQIEGEYTVTYQYISRFESYVGRLTVRDVTGDRKPNLILYEMDYAASGYTVYAQIFGLDTGQQFYAYGDGDL